MRRSLGRILFGVVLLLFGVVGLLEGMGYNLSINYNGWWTVFIIIPCIVSMIEGGIHTGNSIGLVVGVVMLANAQGILPVGFVKLFTFPVILILVGLSLLLGRDSSKYRPSSKKNYGSNDDSDYPDYFVLFGGSEVSNRSRNLKGASITAIFGGIDSDFREAHVDHDITIHVTSIFGGNDVYLPSNVNVRMAGVPIFGDNSNYHKGSANSQSPVITVHAFSLFGGTDIH